MTRTGTCHKIKHSELDKRERKKKKKKKNKVEILDRYGVEYTHSLR